VRAAVGAVVVLALVGAVVGLAEGQLFLAGRAHPQFQVGPLFVRASIGPGLGDVPVDLLFSLVVPPTVSGADVEQDIYLLWPGALRNTADLGPPDPELPRQVEPLGFAVIAEGRTPLSAQSLYQVSSEGAVGGAQAPEPVPGGAPFVTYVLENGAMGLSAPATLVRIPWTPRLVNRAFVMELRLRTQGLVKPKPATWVERTFWGPRHRLALPFSDVRPRAVFPMYFWNRERVIRLSEDPSQLIVNFAEAGRLKVDELFPQSAQRRLSESLDDTEVVSMFLDRGEGLTPQVLTVQFGYFSGLQSWAPVLIPMLFFVLGNLAAPLIRAAGAGAGRAIAARVHFGRDDGQRGRALGIIVPREALARIVPGETRHEDVLRLCGRDPEEHEQLDAPERRTLVYRGRRVVPRRRHRLGWLATVGGWDVEHHEVEISVDGDTVTGVQARVRRTHPPSPDAG
jgi:hypothetical protein